MNVRAFEGGVSFTVRVLPSRINHRNQACPTSVGAGRRRHAGSPIHINGPLGTYHAIAIHGRHGLGCPKPIVSAMRWALRSQGAFSRLGRGSYPLPLTRIDAKSTCQFSFVHFRMPVLFSTQSMHLGQTIRCRRITRLGIEKISLPINKAALKPYPNHLHYYVMYSKTNATHL